MNERIRELEKQCWDYQTNHLNTDKFAELIVRECIEQVRDFYQEDHFNCYNAAERIKDHFGIEE